MRLARAFRIIQRLNSVLFLLAIVAVLVTVAAAAASSMSWGARAAPRPAAVTDPVAGEQLYLGAVEDLEGTPYVLLPLETRTPGKMISSGPSHESETRNLLFYDSSAGTGRWLRPDHRGLIAGYQPLRASGAIQERWEREGLGGDPVRWVRYELVLKDTDRDGETTPRDARQLGISGPAGDDLTIVLEGLDEILGYAPVRDGRMTVFFRRGEGEFGAIVDLRARKLQSEAPLPRL